MTTLIVGIVLFFGVHSVAIASPGWRDAQLARLGEPVWKGIYSAVSLVGLALLIYGFGLVRLTGVMLWHPSAGLRHIALLLMLPVFPLLLATYLPGRLQRAAKHPMLLAVKIWATAHLLANGGLADAVLFGSFLAWAVADRIALKRRAVQRSVAGAPPAAFNDAVAVIGGLALYAAFLAGVHRWFFGVSPLG